METRKRLRHARAPQKVTSAGLALSAHTPIYLFSQILKFYGLSKPQAEGAQLTEPAR